MGVNAGASSPTRLMTDEPRFVLCLVSLTTVEQSQAD